MRSAGLRAETKRILLLIPVYPLEVKVGDIARGMGRSVSDVLWEIASLNADIPLAERMKGGSRVFCFPSIESKRSVLGDTYRI